MSQTTPPAVRATPSTAAGPYVINLCASMTPMALSRPTAPELARFTFFVSRRREEGRERFRLHMGYFQTRDEAEQLLGLIRDLYPAAWVGEAPGKRLAARAAAASAMPPVATGTPQRPAVTKASAAGETARLAATTELSTATAAAIAPPPPKSPSVAMPAARARPSAPEVPASNVREVIASLDGPETAPSAPPAEPRTTRSAGAGPSAATSPAGEVTARTGRHADELSDSQVLRILETRRASAAGTPIADARAAASDIRLLDPGDTQTWRDIRAQISRDAAVHFAVQLAWSVTPIDLDRIPGLAIFNSYTLYKIEGNREGRRWYGLRLGFFSDAISARQVALYVRSEFAGVAVVPVSAKERGDAMQIGAIELSRPAAPAPRPAAEEEFRLIDDAVEAAGAGRSAAADPPMVPARPSESAIAPSAKAVSSAETLHGSRSRGSPQTLEETLEILGASQLSIDDGKGVRLDLGSSAGGAGRSARAASRNSTFSKLLDRLTEKLRS